jgi:protein gp37
MAENTKIEWADHTFNPWIGCAKVSTGCKFCYAETLMDTRYGRVEWGVNGTRVKTGPDNWKKPLQWNRQAEKLGIRYRVFCSSLADVFEDRPELNEWRNELFTLIRITPHLDWLLLTKRPENIRDILYRASCTNGNYLTEPWLAKWWDGDNGAPSNVWLGTSVEDQAAADERIPNLLRAPAKLRFLSCEPLLGSVDLARVLWIHSESSNLRAPVIGWKHFDERGNAGIDWVIAGGESGPKARPMNPDWARSLRDQCKEANVPFLFKQWGEYLPFERDVQPPFWKSQAGDFVDGHGMEFHTENMDWNSKVWHPDSEYGEYAYKRVGKHASGRMLDGEICNELPKVEVEQP